MTARFTALVLATLMVFAACGGAEEVAPSSTALALPSQSDSTTRASTTTASMSASEAPEASEAPKTSETAPARKSGTLGSAIFAADQSTGAQSGRFEATMTMTPGPEAGIDGDVTIHISGAFAANGDSELTMDLSSLMELSMAASDGADFPQEFADVFAEPMQMKVVGDKSYIKWGFFAMFLGTDKWIEGAADESESMTSGFGFGTDGDGPLELLDALADANADVETLGQEDVRGVPTTHYRATLDLEALSQDLTADEREELFSDVGELDISDFPIDIWIGEDGNVYRYSIEVDASTVGGSNEFLGMSMTFEMWDHGADVAIEAPPSDEVATDDEIGFNFGGDV